MEFRDFMKQFDRMCWHYRRAGSCPGGCPMNGVNISQCRKMAFDEPHTAERTVAAWVAEHPEGNFPTWGEWFVGRGDLVEGWCNATNPYFTANVLTAIMHTPIPDDIAPKLGL